MAEQLLEMGCDSICIKDMAGLLKPQPAYELVRGIKEQCGQDVLVHVHTHATTGVTLVSLMKAIDAGADIVDTAISLDEPRTRAQPDREPDRHARRHRVQDARGPVAGSGASTSISRSSGRAIRSS